MWLGVGLTETGPVGRGGAKSCALSGRARRGRPAASSLGLELAQVRLRRLRWLVHAGMCSTSCLLALLQGFGFGFVADRSETPGGAVELAGDLVLDVGVQRPIGAGDQLGEH